MVKVENVDIYNLKILKFKKYDIHITYILSIDIIINTIIYNIYIYE